MADQNLVAVLEQLLALAKAGDTHAQPTGPAAAAARDSLTYTVPEAAKLLGVSSRLVYDLAARPPPFAKHAPADNRAFSHGAGE